MPYRKIIKKQQFPHKDDNKLYLVLAEFNGQFVTWEYNSEFNGYSQGNYFNDIDQAKKDFNRRWEKLNS
jgi:hypothetical protein